ncbi:MAG: ferrochelatase [Salinibacter sp.]
MTPLDFLRLHDPSWSSFEDVGSESSLRIVEGDCVGVVVFNLGGPASLDDVEPFLYNLLMDPLLFDLPVEGRLRHWLAKSAAYVRAQTLRERYEMIGGGSPLTRLAREQAQSLQGHLASQYGQPTGVEFRTYSAMRYGHPFMEEAAAEMAADGVDKVVLLPAYPQFSTSTTGSALAYWTALGAADERASWPTTVVPEYAANPKYVQAVSERIDQALQRFPRTVRGEVVLVFSAHDTVFGARGKQGNPYCCHVHSTVEQVMRHRNRDRPFHTTFQSVMGPNSWLSPSTPDTIETLGERGRRSVLIVPISFVTDHVNTSYDLDISVRARAEAQGIDHFEVTASLNTHPLFIEALGEATAAQLDLPVDVNQLRFGGDGQSQGYPLRPYHQRPRHGLNGQSSSCPECGSGQEARRWTLPNQSAEPDAPSDPSSTRPDPPVPQGSESPSDGSS